MARKVVSLELTMGHSKDYVDKFKNLITDGAQCADCGQRSQLKHKEDAAQKYKKFSTDGAQGDVLRAHVAAQQRLCGKVQRQQRALSSCIYPFL
jgi:hypothetical protein